MKPSLSRTFASHIERRADELAGRWLDALAKRMAEHRRDIFPGRTALDHIPLMMRRIGESFEHDDDVDVPLDLDVSDQIASELARLAQTRRQQGHSLEEFLLEFDLLECVLLDVLEDASQDVPGCGNRALMHVTRRLQARMSTLVRLAGRAFNQSVTSDRHDRAQMLDGFSRAVSHELRNRLNAAVLMLTTVRRKLPAVDTSTSTLLDRLEHNLRGIDDVVGDVFSVAVAHGRIAVDDTGRVPLCDLVERLVAETVPMAEQLGIVLTVLNDVPDVLVDGPRLQLALVNLLSNAIKYADPDKPSSWVRVEIHRVEEQPVRYEVHVCDNGIGIPEDERTAIFQRFVRGHNVGSREGLGLGLSLSAEAVAQMGGELRVESQPGQGSRFIVALTLPHGRAAQRH